MYEHIPQKLATTEEYKELNLNQFRGRQRTITHAMLTDEQKKRN